MAHFRRRGIGIPIAVAVMSIALWGGGCGFGGNGGRTATTASRSVAQVMLLRDGFRGGSGLEVLLLHHGPKALFGPGAWVFPSGASRSGDAREAAARAAGATGLDLQAGIKVNPSALVPYAEWVLPPFDTRFYLAPAPADSKPHPDGSTNVAAGWYEPRRALDMHNAGKLELAYPTIKQLESVVGFANAAQALRAARSRGVAPVKLRIVGAGDKRHAVLPDEAPQG